MNTIQLTRTLLPLGLALSLLGASSASLGEEVVRIIQTNYAGTNAHVIDPVTNEVVDIIDNVPKAHAAVNHPDGTYYYFANEHTDVVDVVDVPTLQVVQQIQLMDRPNKLVINKALGKLYVGIRDSAYVQVIDLDSHEVIKSIPVLHGVHNIYVTDDQQWMIVGLGEGPDNDEEPTIQVIDPHNDEVVFGISLQGHRVRPMAIESNADGSPKRIFAQATRLNGFFVVDWDKREAVDFISPPPLPISQQNFDGIQEGTGHGLLVLPDQSALWYASRLDSRVYTWSLP
ncbi:MAG TPA: hypothetical protein VIV14_03005, partial [Gammaproteobacteria bacterium]